MIAKKPLHYTLLIVLLLSISACAPLGYTPDAYGFFAGLWHGMCWPFALIGKLIGLDIGLYAQNNNGFFYWAGFIIGFLSLSGSSARNSNE